MASDSRVFTDLLTEALGVFESCVCIPESSDTNTLLIKLAFLVGLTVSLGDCGLCREEVRTTPDVGQPGRRLLLIARSLPSPDLFLYSDVILLQYPHLLRLDRTYTNGRKFRPLPQMGFLKVKGKLVDFENRTFTAAHYECPPLLMRLKGEYLGLEHDLLMELSKALNFQLNYLPLNSSNEWGVEANGTWVGGVIGSVLHRQSDIGLCGVWLRSSQVKYVDISAPYGQMNLGFIVSKTPTEENWKSIYSPFSPLLWMSVLSTLILSTFSMAILSKLSGNRESVVDWVFLVMGHFVGCRSLPTVGPTSFRAGVVLVSLTALILGTLYSSSIVSHLTSPPVQPEPETVRDLVLRRYSWSRSKPVENLRAILNPEDEWQRRLMGQYKPLSGMGPAMASREYAFFLSYISRLFVTREIPDVVKTQADLRLLKEVIGQHLLGIAFSKGSPLTPHFSHAINRLIASGVIKKMSRDMEYRMKSIIGNMEDQQRIEHNPLTLGAMQGAFSMFLGGQICATTTFVLEVIIKMYTKNPSRTTEFSKRIPSSSY